MTAQDNAVYLDNNATTEPFPEVLEAVESAYKKYYGNPSSVHALGRNARAELDRSRKTIADLLNTRSPSEVIFVSCATEANALTIRGLVQSSTESSPHIITSSIEHPSILETCKELEERGTITVSYLPVDQNGIVDPDDLLDELQENTILVSIMTANNEVGSIQPVTTISEICQEHNVPFHSDGVQTIGKIPVDLQNPEYDLFSISGHKFHGPRGIGVLIRKRTIELSPLLRGGGQEEQLRSGTEATPLTSGLAVALEQVEQKRKEQADQMEQLREYFWQELHEQFQERVVRNTPSKSKALPNTLNVSFLDKEADKLLMKLDLQNIYVSAGAACHSGAIEISHVLEAMNVPEEVARGSVRFSLSLETTRKEIDRTLAALNDIFDG